MRSGESLICNCCGCCCEALLVARKFGNMHTVATTSFILSINHESYATCGKCVKAYPIRAIKKINENGKYVIKIDEEV